MRSRRAKSPASGDRGTLGIVNGEGASVCTVANVAASLCETGSFPYAMRTPLSITSDAVLDAIAAIVQVESIKGGETRAEQYFPALTRGVYSIVEMEPHVVASLNVLLADRVAKFNAN